MGRKINFKKNSGDEKAYWAVRMMFRSLCKSRLASLAHYKPGLWSSYNNVEAYAQDQVLQVCASLGAALGFGDQDATQPAKVARVIDYYLPLTLWCAEQSKLGKLRGSGAAVVGLSMPQGGKWAKGYSTVLT